MKIAVFGAAGQVGSRVVAEALARGHAVTAVGRRARKSSSLPKRVHVQVADASRVGTCPAALASAAQLDACRAESGVDWAYLNPPAELQPGIRTGTFRVGRDELLVDEGGRSRISIEDLAVALLDEAERPSHRRIRFTAAY